MDVKDASQRLQMHAQEHPSNEEPFFIRANVNEYHGLYRLDDGAWAAGKQDMADTLTVHAACDECDFELDITDIPELINWP